MNKATTKNKTSAWILIAVILCAAVTGIHRFFAGTSDQM